MRGKEGWNGIGKLALRLLLSRVTINKGANQTIHICSAPKWQLCREPPTYDVTLQIGFRSNKKTRYMMPSGHKAFLVSNTQDVELLLMHNRTYAAEYVSSSSFL
jgi:hypothetical protein